MARSAVAAVLIAATAISLVAAACAEKVAPSSRRGEEGVPADPLDPAWIRATMRSVADWQLEHLRGKPEEWTNAVFYSGLAATHRSTGDSRYLAALVEVGESARWRVGDRIRHADDHAIAQTYLELFRHQPDPRRVEPFRAAVDRMMAEPRNWTKPHQKVDYWWCDALFMSPPALAQLAAVTGETTYLDFMDRLWAESYELLFDREAGLFHRDLRFRERSGAFWARGNGWVLAGLARLLDELPADRPNRAFYEKVFRNLADRAVEFQGEDGLWRSDLRAPDRSAPGESSASALFGFALAWGVERGLLDRERFFPAVAAAWAGLARNVDSSGRLGWVQPRAAEPGRAGKRHTAAYGSGALLLAAEQVLALAEEPR